MSNTPQDTNVSLDQIKCYTLPPKKAPQAKSLVIMLHGLGADGRDLMALAPYLQEALPETAFLAPDAPFPCDMAPMGYQWFSLQDRSEGAMLDGVHKASGILNALIDSQLKEYDLPAEKCALFGFSQGTMLALHTALRREEPLGGVLGFSGALIGAELLEEELRSKPPVHLVHGMRDDIVPFSAHAPALNALKGFDVPVTTTTCPELGKSIDEDGMRDGTDFLMKVLG